jgi:hypothetical protein
MNLRQLDAPNKIQRHLYETEQTKKTLLQKRRDFMSRCATAFSRAPLKLELAGQREMVWRKRTAVTGGPQSTVEFHTPAGQQFLATLAPHVLERYIELDAERILLNMQIRIVTAQVLSLKQYLVKHQANQVLAQQGVCQ